MLVSDGKSFLSHRLGLARAARDAGWAVTVIMPPCPEVAAARGEGFEVVESPMRRDLRAPWEDLRAAWQIASVLRRCGADVVHNFALKPALVGTLACRIARIRTVVNTVAGMGYIFINQGLKARVLRTVIVAGFRALIDRAGTAVIVQNRDDHAAVAGPLVHAERVVLVRGSGVDVGHYTPQPEPGGTPVAALVARMLWDKGVGELVEASRLLRQRGIPLRIALVGDTDPANPRCIPPEQLAAWQREGVIEWWGFRADVRAVWGECHIAVLPSYREGLPKALLEAAACGRPLVTTDVPGCREMVTDQVDGLLVPARQAAPLADALERLARSESERQRLGTAARRRVETELCDSVVHDAILGLYQQLLRAGEKQAEAR
jgi:glycosyltransferase involved in cell wall biosynthesis